MLKEYFGCDHNKVSKAILFNILDNILILNFRIQKENLISEFKKIIKFLFLNRDVNCGYWKLCGCEKDDFKNFMYNQLKDVNVNFVICNLLINENYKIKFGEELDLINKHITDSFEMNVFLNNKLKFFDRLKIAIYHIFNKGGYEMFEISNDMIHHILYELEEK